MLTNLTFPVNMNTSEYDVPNDFFKPILQNSIVYYRGVGYFSSSWLKHNSEGLIAFAENGGVIKWITSPILSQEDLESFIIGEDAKNDELLKQRLEESIIDLEESLNSDVLNALSWMISDDIINIKLAVPCGKLSGEFHDKFGYFEDVEGNSLSFNGSNNESQHGVISNYESFTIFYSWHNDKEISNYSINNKIRFERLWNNGDENLKVFQIPDAVKKKIIKLRKDSQRPYKLLKSRNKGPSLPRQYSLIRDYQNDAYNNWSSSQYCGIFAMATGTGKTVTSLFCALKEYERRCKYDQDAKIQLIILVPTKTLVHQWEKDVKAFNFFPLISAYSDNSNWKSEVQDLIDNYKYIGLNSNFSIISTYTSFTLSYSEIFSKLPDDVLLIADEVHNFGSSSCLEIIDKIKYLKKIGLSATPKRIYSEDNSKKIEDFFKSHFPYTYSYSMEKAINNNILVRYDYRIKYAELDDEEFDEYCELSLEIAKSNNNSDDKNQYKINDQQVKKLIKRKRLINGAKSKRDVLIDIFYELERNNKIKYCLVYAPGGDDYFNTFDNDESQRIILQMQSIIKENFPEIKQMSYLGETKDRNQAIESFKNGNIDVLFAINCLDEGVDIPRTEIGVFTASSGNPRQYIQRRGRLLRKHNDKKKALIYDMVVLPPTILKNNKYFSIAKNLVINELRRARYFIELSEQKYLFNNYFEDILHKYNIALDDVNLDEEFL